MKKNFILCLMAMLMTNYYYVNAQFKISADFIPRFEYRHGFKSLIDSAQQAGSFVSQRSRIIFGYESEKIKVGLSVQDIRTWGSTSQLNLTDGLFSVHEAWIDYSLFKDLSLKLGRQELVYNNHRILGNVDWALQGRSHDAALVKYTGKPITIHAGFAYNQNAESNLATSYTVTSSYKAMQFLWLNKTIGKASVSGLFLNSGQQSPITTTAARFSQTIGSHLEFKPTNLAITASGYYQMGKDASYKDLSAYEASVDIRYTIASKLTLGAGYERLSGQSQTDTTTAYTDVNHVFTPLYGTNHKFNGYMDYFYVGSGHSNVGLQDAYAVLRYKATKWFIMAEPHLFMSAADILDTDELASSGEYKALSSYLGTEIDVTFGYELTQGANLQIGYSHLLPTASLETIKGSGSLDETQNWAYVMFRFTPTLFKQ